MDIPQVTDNPTYKKTRKTTWVLVLILIIVTLIALWGIYVVNPPFLVGRINRLEAGVFSEKTGSLELNNFKTILEFDDNISFVDKAKFYEDSSLIDDKSPYVIIKNPKFSKTTAFAYLNGPTPMSKVYKFSPENVVYLGKKPTNSLEFSIKLSDAITKLFASKVFQEKEVKDSSDNTHYTTSRSSVYKDGVWKIDAGYGASLDNGCQANVYLVGPNSVEALRWGCNDKTLNFDIKE